jgi:hypothetical protein
MSIFAAFDRFPEEAARIGRMLAAYSVIELDLLEGSAIFARQTTLGAKINNISLIVRDSNRLQLVGAVKSLPPFPPFRGRLVMLSGFVLP